MRSTFAGLSIAISGAWAQQRALDVTGHNISNVNTPGYSRQSVIHASTSPTYIGVSGNGNLMNVGTGVDVQEIRQYRDYFLDQKLRRENQELGYWDARKGSIEELETIFNDNTEDGLQSVMDSFWNSWSQLSKPGGGLTARSLVKENAIAFVETVKNLDKMLIDFRRNRNNEIKENVDKLNALTKNIADINYDIKKIEGSGVIANDLRDQRDKDVLELSKMVNIQVVEGTVFNINLGGRLLVADTEYNPLVAVPEMSADGYYSIKWSKTMENMNIDGGSVKALIETRDELVDGFRDRLNEFVKGVAEEVNKLHLAGYGNIDSTQRVMFVNSTDNTTVGMDISNIGYNTELLEVNNIAAAKLAPPGNYEDNQNALEISEWRLKDVFTDTQYDAANGKFNFDEFYRSIITDIGLEGNKAANAADAQNLLVEQVENRRQSLMAVSLDEEMSNLIKYENSYNAAARIVNALDEMLDVIVNKIGLGGR
ncbi:MAG: flagellar hook-associated protein FlgK [Clostridiales bacterium GWB2_37_7]|nr:MAG: flagellar hook-associated protein FlgK [Clostridiales bacterium GWB2_37_7]